MPFDLWYELFGNDTLRTAREEQTPDCMIDDYVERAFLTASSPPDDALDYNDIQRITENSRAL